MTVDGQSCSAMAMTTGNDSPYTESMMTGDWTPGTVIREVCHLTVGKHAPDTPYRFVVTGTVGRKQRTVEVIGTARFDADEAAFCSVYVWVTRNLDVVVGAGCG